MSSIGKWQEVKRNKKVPQREICTPKNTVRPLCKKWEKSGFCDHGISNKRCLFNHPAICNKYATQGVCNTRSSCTFHHPLDFCNPWITKGFCLCQPEEKIYKFHPKLCLRPNCDCTYLFHPYCVEDVPPNLADIKIFTKRSFSKICDPSSPLEDFVDILDDITEYFNVDSTNLAWLIDEIIKKRRVDILTCIVNNKKLKFFIKLLSNDVSYSPFNKLVWAYNGADEDYHVIIKLAEILIGQKFKLFSQNGRYHHEDIFKTLFHADNPIESETRNQIFEYLVSCGDESYWFSIFLNIFNKLDRQNEEKIIDIGLFIFTKCNKSICERICTKFLSVGKSVNSHSEEKVFTIYSTVLMKFLSCKPSDTLFYFHAYFEKMDLVSLQYESIQYILDKLESWQEKIRIGMSEHQILAMKKNLSSILSAVYLCSSREDAVLNSKFEELLVNLDPLNFMNWMIESRIDNRNVGVVDCRIVKSYIKRNKIRNDEVNDKRTLFFTKWLYDNRLGKRFFS
jgi:hypothetical protein